MGPKWYYKLGNLLMILNTCKVVKQRMQTGQFASAPDAVRLIVANEGFKGLYAVCEYLLSSFYFHNFKFSV